MKILNLEQNTKAWLLSRVETIGGSEVPSLVMGKSPYGEYTRAGFYRDKALNRASLRLGLLTEENIKMKQNNFIMGIGHWVESWMRPMVELEYMRKFEPIVATREKPYEYMSVSFDGLDREHNEVWECKFTGYGNVLLPACPPHFYLQVQYQLMICGGEIGYLSLVALDSSKKKLREKKTLIIKAHKETQDTIHQWIETAQEEIEKIVPTFEKKLRKTHVEDAKS